jgi:molecular chaperone HscB
MTSLHRLALRTAASFSAAQPQLHGTCIRSRLMSASASATAPPSDTANHDETHNSFQILGLEHSFAIDPDMLKQSYRKLMIDFHPDKHSLKDVEVQEAFEKRASAVTRAYDTLKHPHTRASHLLEVLGHPMEDQAEGDLVGMVFLMEIMEVREIIDNTVGDDELRPLLLENQKEIDETSELLSEAFKQTNLEKALELTAQIQYFTRIDETIRDKMKSLD